MIILRGLLSHSVLKHVKSVQLWERMTKAAAVPCAPLLHDLPRITTNTKNCGFQSPIWPSHLPKHHSLYKRPESKHSSISSALRVPDVPDDRVPCVLLLAETPATLGNQKGQGLGTGRLVGWSTMSSSPSPVRWTQTLQS